MFFSNLSGDGVILPFRGQPYSVRALIATYQYNADPGAVGKFIQFKSPGAVDPLFKVVFGEEKTLSFISNYPLFTSPIIAFDSSITFDLLLIF